MWKFLCVVLMVLVSQGTNAKVFWETEEIAENYLQRVPPIKATAEKMMRYLFGRTTSHIVKRSAPRPDDVLIVIDSSKSIPESNFTRCLYALQGMIERFKPDARFASILFSTKAEVMFKFLPAKKAMEKLLTIRYNGGFTNTQDALKKSGRLFVSRTSGGRRNAYKKMFILTDGQSNIKKERTLYLAYVLKELGIEIYVMAVGERIEGINELGMLATSTDKHLYRVGEMDQFMQVVQEIPKDPYYEKNDGI
ncbi:collagen alpha-1(XII) chain-like [Actinia tenebrosa]|uniref:Collagen alpha-1(XII) chain-like n=1 Tax=Actinia tenebrosa TaxID=6105 RepID=A0A6P8HVG4_ACTTE|nr:collagen alpha-1(XII) chain-like [Actinia tenebrosa]